MVTSGKLSRLEETQTSLENRRAHRPAPCLEEAEQSGCLEGAQANWMILKTHSPTCWAACIMWIVPEAPSFVSCHPGCGGLWWCSGPWVFSAPVSDPLPIFLQVTLIKLIGYQIGLRCKSYFSLSLVSSLGWAAICLCLLAISVTQPSALRKASPDFFCSGSYQGPRWAKSF